MRKRCTESACRRVFTVNTKAVMTSCPHCGRIYPRIPANPQGATYTITIRDPGISAEKMAGWIRLIFPNCRYRNAYYYACTRSVFTKTGLSLKEAVRIRRKLVEAGAEPVISRNIRLGAR